MSGRIDFGNQIALFDLLSEFDIQFLNLTRSLRTDRYQIRRRNFARGRYSLVNIATLDRFGKIFHLFFGLKERPNRIDGNNRRDKYRHPLHYLFHHIPIPV